MCDPVTLSTIAIASTIASGAAKVGGDVVAANAENARAAAVKSNAFAAEKSTDLDLSTRELQEKIAGSEKITAGERQAGEAAGATRAGAAGAGVGGMTVDLLLDNESRQLALYKDSVNQQTTANVQQLDREKDAAYATYQSRVTSAPPANPWATALKIGGDVAGTAGQIASFNPSRIGG